MKTLSYSTFKRNLIFCLFLCSLFSESLAQWQAAPFYLEDRNLPAGYTSLQLRLKNDVEIDNSNNTYVAFQRIGLGKFDGTNWTMYNVSNGSLQSDTVPSVAVDGSGNIYAATTNGLSEYSGSTWTHYNGINSPLPANGATTVEVNSGVRWIGTKNGIFRFDGVNWTSFNTSNSGLGNDTITCIAFDGSTTYAGTKNGLYKYDGSSWSTLTPANPSLQNISDVEVNAGEPWIALSNGAVYYYDLSLALHQLLLPPKIYGCTDFGNNNSTCLKSGNGNIYFFIPDPTIGKPVLCYTDASHKIFTYFNNPDTYVGSTAILFDVNNNLISCTFSNNGPNQPSFFSDNIFTANVAEVTSDLLEYSNLNVNKVNARVNNQGDMHWDPVGQTPIYTVPACSNKNSIYSSGIWIGGLDVNNQIRAAAMTYSQGGADDFNSGPLDTITGTTDSITSAMYNRTWKVNKITIDDFIYNYQQGNVTNGSYTIPEVIANWPAHGGGSYSRDLAPFYDNNNDGNYNPYDGDYPSITGDQEIWFIFNDQQSHTETFCPAFGVEIHGKAYAFTCSAPDAYNDVINYTTFYQYKIINRSSEVYHDMKIGMFVDPDLGNAADDYVGCHVGMNTGIVYNADPDDDGANGYGSNPPYQNVTILQGPLADPLDGLDNDRDNTIDEVGECNMMSNFMYYNNINLSPNGNPAVCDDYMQYLNSTWLDGTPVTFGGTGSGPGTPTNFMFPGTTDPAFPGQNWTMASAAIAPDDMRFIISSGNFSLNPGSSRTIDFAYIYTRDTVGPWPSVTNNELQIAKVIQWFNSGLGSCPVPVSIEEDGNAAQSLIVHPNPADKDLYIELTGLSKNSIYTITDATGRICLEGKLVKMSIDVSKLNAGAYHLSVTGENGIGNAGFIKK